MAGDSGGNAIPMEIQVLAQRSIAQAKHVCASLLAAAEQALHQADSRMTAARTGAKEAGDLARRFAERNIAASFAFAEKLARAKDAQEVLDLHADYAGNQIAALGEQAKELSRKAAKLAGEVAH